MNSPTLGTASRTTADRMPKPSLRGTERLTDIGHVLNVYQQWTNGIDVYPTGAQRRVLGIGLPKWQRQLKWDEAQMVRYVSSCWQNHNVGCWVINVLWGDAPELDGLLIDGQQRLTALQRYFDNCLPVPAADGTPLYWADLTRAEQRRFERVPLHHIELRYTDEIELMRLYDLLNFSGVPHEESERALGNADSDHT